MELFPDGWEIARISSGQEVPSDERVYTFTECIPAKGSKVKGKYIDSGFSGVYPYVIRIYLRLEQDEITVGK